MKQTNETTFFWKKFEALLKRDNKTAQSVAKEMGISKATISKWKNEGIIPSGDTLAKIADTFDVTIDFLLGETEISLKPDLKKEEKYGVFKTLKGLPQRFLALRHGDWKTDIISRTLKYISVSKLDFAARVSFDDLVLLDSSEWEYDSDIFEIILGMMDFVPDSDVMKDFQVILSRAILKRVDEKLGETYSLLSESHKSKSLMIDKLKYLYYNDMSGDSNWQYGLNFTELNIIREEYNISFLFMLTGHEYSEIFT